MEVCKVVPEDPIDYLVSQPARRMNAVGVWWVTDCCGCVCRSVGAHRPST